MPLIRYEVPFDTGEERVFNSFVGKGHPAYPFFAVGMGGNFTTKGIRQKLPAETNPEKRDIPVKAVTDNPFHLPKKRIPAIIPGSHCPAEDNHRCSLFRRRY
jgi:hypothetical protein